MMLDIPSPDGLFLGLLIAGLGFYGLASRNKGVTNMKDYSTIRELAKLERVPYTVIQGWVRHGYVKAIRAGQGGDWRVSGENGTLCHHTVVSNLDVSSLAGGWRARNGVPKYLTVSQRNRYVKKQKGIERQKARSSKEFTRKLDSAWHDSFDYNFDLLMQSHKK